MASKTRSATAKTSLIPPAESSSDIPPAESSGNADPTTSTGQKTGHVELPEPDSRIDEAREDDLTTIVDILSGAKNDNEVFDQKYKNVDDLVKDYREKLVAVVRGKHGSRDSCYTILQRAIVHHRKANWEPVRAQVFEWAAKGYEGELSDLYFDDNGQPRPKSEEEDPEYVNRKVDDTRPDEDMPDVLTLPENMEFYEKLWKKAGPHLSRLLKKPTSYKKKTNKDRLAIDKLNGQLHDQQKKDKAEVDLNIPDEEMLLLLVTCTEQLAGHLSGKATSTTEAYSTEDKQKVDAALELFSMKIKRATQPESWANDLRDAVNTKAELLATKGSKRDQLTGLWKEDFLKSLNIQDDEENQPKTSTSEAPNKESEKPKTPKVSETSSPEASKQGSQTPKSPKKKSSTFVAGSKKGSHRIKSRSDRVLWQNEERMIGGVRLWRKSEGFGETWQILVQANDEKDPVYPVWWLLPSKTFGGRRKVRRYIRETEDSVIVHEMRGTFDDLDDKDIEELDIEGIAFIPRKNGDYYHNGEQFIKGSFEGEETLFWDKSTLGQAFGGDYVQQHIDKWLYDADIIPPRKAELVARRSGRNRQRKHRQAKHKGRYDDNDSDLMEDDYDDEDYDDSELDEMTDGSDQSDSATESESDYPRRTTRNKNRRDNARPKRSSKGREHRQSRARSRDNDDSSSATESESDRPSRTTRYRKRKVDTLPTKKSKVRSHRERKTRGHGSDSSGTSASESEDSLFVSQRKRRGGKTNAKPSNRGANTRRHK